MRQTILFGRILFSLIFIISGFSHFTEATITYAGNQGVAFPGLLVPLSGLLAILGGLSVLFGYKTKVGAWMLIVFLVPVTFVMHAFWLVGDPTIAQTQQIMFLKNLSMLGGAFSFAYFGAGAYSLDSRVHTDERTHFVASTTSIPSAILPTPLRKSDEKDSRSTGII